MKAAVYARYSTTLQRRESIADQFRVCERIAERHGFRIVAQYADEAISGGTASKRPGYLQMLTDARTGKFDVIMAEDVSRLWRNLAEQSPRLAELNDLGIAVVTHDLDTREETSGILGAVTGAMSEGYRREIARRTRRGLEGLARAKRPTGGRAYGYISAADSESEEREINTEEARVVQRIFKDYADGLSAASICEALNHERIPSPGSTWSRKIRRSRGWVVSAIAGDRRRGIGILNNELYTGKVLWNRFRWVRSAADSSKRKCLPNPRKDWIEYQDERLRIIPDDLWQKVKQRQYDIEQKVGRRVAQGIALSKAHQTGPRVRHLLSGLLRCGRCSASFVVSGRDTYVCSSVVHGRDCTNRVRIKRAVVEPLLLDGLRTQILQPANLERARKRLVAALQAKSTPDQALSRRIDALRGEVANLADAIASGALRGSKAIADRLAATESELSTLEARQVQAPESAIAKLTPRVVDALVRAADDMPALVRGTNPERGRAVIESMIGEVFVEPTETEIRFEAEKTALEGAFMRAIGAKHANVVAGARYVICVLPK
jgi:site-specific DNA recombinase